MGQCMLFKRCIIIILDISIFTLIYQDQPSMILRAHSSMRDCAAAGQLQIPHYVRDDKGIKSQDEATK